MGILTERQLLIFTNPDAVKGYSREEKLEAMAILNQFQADNTDAQHVAKINSFIMAAEHAASKEFNPIDASQNGSWTKAYHAHMNRLTRAAKLRA